MNAASGLCRICDASYDHGSPSACDANLTSTLSTTRSSLTAGVVIGSTRSSHSSAGSSYKHAGATRGDVLDALYHLRHGVWHPPSARTKVWVLTLISGIVCSC